MIAVVSSQKSVVRSAKSAARCVLLSAFCLLSLVAVAVPVIAQNSPPKRQPVTIVKRDHKHRKLWKVFTVPAKFVAGGLLRIVLDSKGEPY